jgi:Carboxypeptidase regulatory-like domain
MRVFGHFFILVLAALILVSRSAAAQTDQRSRLTITVADPSGAVVPNATVTLTGLEPPAKATPVPGAKTTDKGVAVFEDLAPGRYSVRAEFPGFQIGQLPDVRVTRGDNTHVVILPLQTLAESVIVDAGAQAADRASRAFGLTVTDEQVQALSDDPDEMTRQLNDIAGSGAIIRVDSFEGQQLPPKSQIKSIHVTRDHPPRVLRQFQRQPGQTLVLGQRRDVQLAATRSFAHGAMGSDRSTCRRAGRWRPNGATGRPTTLTV